MAERTHIPSSPACGEWETLLTDALDGLLKPEHEAKFTAHKAVCPACAALYEEARKGREWLEFLSPEPEAPAGLLERLLAHTGPGHAPPAGWTVGGALPAAAGTTVPDFVPPVWQQPGFFTRLRASVQPRLVLTAAMAFFSIALTLSMTGVHLTSLQWSDLRPSAVRSYMERQLAEASVPIVRYYDHLRFVYEVKSRVRELRGEKEGEGIGEPNRNETQPATPGQTRQNPAETPGHNDGGLRVDPRQEPDNPAMEPAARPAADASTEVLEASLAFQGDSVQSGASQAQRLSAVVGDPGSQPQRLSAVVGDPGSPARAWERSKVWIA
jgi:hypothetical protein